ncbi:fibronectin type III domain-containing protein [Aquimarina brevivitae]|uniref:Fibronectin type-III domain-containing protein n=1 Tax=Aquimarina brevivitae TaxID=323412 RepID=A0A4Q7PKR0_9FLAO|nr:fibronectin type III domain-containing protein [Aquimarina brevivitae]RZS99552.1 hypothetical protein EV197_0774 [Aquimarina brevivitae]
MKKKVYLANLIIICLWFLGCNNDDETTTNPQNQRPGNINIEVDQITNNTALLSWNAAVNPDDDLVTYTVFLGDTEIQSNIETTEFLLESLIAQTNYNGKVVASDSNGGTSENTFDFTTSEGETTNEQPSIAWERSFGGSQIDEANAVVLTQDGGYAIVGTSYSDDGDVESNNDNDGYLGGDIWVIRLDSSGDLIWETNLGGSLDERGNSIRQTSDNGFIIAGSSNSSDQDISGDSSFVDFWVVKLDQNGILDWEVNYGGGGNEGANSIQQTMDEGYIVAGFTSSSNGDVGGNNGSLDYWIIKLDTTGSLVWEKNLGGSGIDIARAIEQTNDGGYIVAGSSASSDGDVGTNYGEEDYWVVKLDASGNLVWETNLGGSSEDLAYDIEQTLDQGYIIAGYSESSDIDVTDNHGGRDFWIVKLDISGGIVWENNIGGSESDTASSIQQTSDQGYIIAGNSASNDFDTSTNLGALDYWVLKINDTGVLMWEISLGGPLSDYANAIQQTNDGYILAGYTQGPGGDIGGTGKGSWDYWVVKLE